MGGGTSKDNPFKAMGNFMCTILNFPAVGTKLLIALVSVICVVILLVGAGFAWRLKSGSNIGIPLPTGTLNL